MKLSYNPKATVAYIRLRERQPAAPPARCATKCCAGTVSPYFNHISKYTSKYTSHDISPRARAPFAPAASIAAFPFDTQPQLASSQRADLEVPQGRDPEMLRRGDITRKRKLQMSRMPARKR
jgi:hypothetical protein